MRQLELVACTSFLPDYLSSLYNGVFVAMPEDTALDNLDLYARSLVADVAEGKVDQIIANALEDGRLDEAELADIVAAHREHIAARHAEVGAVITLHRKTRAVRISSKAHERHTLLAKAMAALAAGERR